MRWVITGANRGIGLEFVRQLAARGDHVEAFVRQPSDAKDLDALAKASKGLVRVSACDVGADKSVKSAVQALDGAPVDVVVNNAGISGKMMALADLDLEDVIHTFDVNALGAIRVTRALLPNLLAAQTRRVVSITSGMGSIQGNDRGGAYAYRMSKAALNMANRSMSIDLASDGFTCVVFNPGWVKTDMGGEAAPTEVEDSVTRMVGIIDGLTPEKTGTFIDYRGHTLPY